MKKPLLLAAAIALSTQAYATAQPANQQTPTPKQPITLHENYSITLENLAVTIGKQKQNLTIIASWQYQPNVKPSDYIDSNQVVKSINVFFQGYPNKDAYWELINHDLTTSIFDNYSQMHKLTMTLILPPSKADPYAKISKDTAIRKS